MINRDEWMAAVRAVEGVELRADAMTRRELSILLGVGATTAKERIRKLVADGKARPVMKQIKSASGVMVTIPAYLLVKAK